MNSAMSSPTTPVQVNGLPKVPRLKERLKSIRDALCGGLIEREVPIRLALLAAHAGEHLLLIGPPGTAKSELARRLRLAFTGQTYFERLLTRFSVPEELFGPLSIKALEEDKYQRQTDGYLPTAAVAFLDEIFKANSAILNSLLTLLNEREFDNGTQRIKTPLVSVVGASNELPHEEELLALYDRFLVRYHVGPVTDDGFAKLLELRGQAKPAIDAALMFTPSDLEHIHAAAMKVTVPDEVASLLKAMRKHCQDQKIPVSDRRWRKALFLLQVAAHTDGRAAVSVWDCWLLQHCLWHKPEEITALGKWYEERAGAACPREPERYNRVAGAWEQKLEEDKGKRVQKQNAEGQPLYKDRDGEETPEKQRKDRYNRVEGENDPIMDTIKYAKAHVDGRVRDVDQRMAEVKAFIARGNAAAKTMDSTIRGHIWLDPALAVPAVRNLQEHIKRATDVLARLEKSKLGFQQLPVEDELDIDGNDSIEPATPRGLPPTTEQLQRFVHMYRTSLDSHPRLFSVDFLKEVLATLNPDGTTKPGRSASPIEELGMRFLVGLFEADQDKDGPLSDVEIAELAAEYFPYPQ